MKSKNFRSLMPVLAFIILLISCEQKEEPNTLTGKEEEDGWVLLFDGKTTKGWHLYNKPGIISSWTAVNGELICDQNAKNVAHGDFVTDNVYADFDLVFDWKITKGGNSGVFVNVIEDTAYLAPWFTGPEYQLLDNANTIDHNKDDTLRQAGCIFGLTALKNNASAKPFGEWNNSRIVQQDGKLTFWLNGIISTEINVNSDRWNELVAASNFKALPAFGKASSGHIVLQDWAKGISFRNIKIKEYR